MSDMINHPPVAGDHKLTEEQVDTILRLATECDHAGRWRWSYGEVAVLVGVSHALVANCVREAGKRWASLTAWRDEPWW